MEENKQKLTYEQLEAMCKQLSQKNMEFATRLAQSQKQLESINVNALTLKYLFKVVKYKENFPKEFVDSSISTIIEFMSEKDNTETTEE